ncbi:MAG: bifunctional 2-polyprenyl-6-hydroxyphenol methylase/3-demethylubiquinol 3-O-methyltransferase UbiG [Alphaproteobacteria bacterium]|nr:bifunctional 2-polyprenyl-6-hydroxyphenol methylase/3-demethylubiquinol 3-O-methyltransferase UbiG [Alphaproteobacteria bacterium]
MTDNRTVDREEIDRFSTIGAEWWDPEGPMRPLHRLSPFRTAWIWQQCATLLDRPVAGADRPLDGLTLLDIGCGGGLVSEPMAELGAAVTGIDADEKGIAAAKAHAADSGLEIDYRCATSGDLLAEGLSFDIVLALEIIEHTADPMLFQEEVAALCKPGGLVIASTLNRTVASYLGGVLAAEYLLGWVPRGTHDWRKFIKPSEMAAGFRPHGLGIREMAGVSWEPTTDSFRASRDFSINYIMAFRKDG